jgi:hypothetical protein
MSNPSWVTRAKASLGAKKKKKKKLYLFPI